MEFVVDFLCIERGWGGRRAEVGPTGGRMLGVSIDLDAKAVGIMTGSLCITGT